MSLRGSSPGPTPDRRPAAPLGRRSLLKAGLAAGAGAGLALAGGPLERLAARAAAVAPAAGGLRSVDHVVFLIQENRSFDHYFGTLSGVRGFDDHPPGRPGVFSQVWPGDRAHGGRLLPYHLDSAKTAGECVHDITHAWTAQHACWNGGHMDRFVAVHTAEDGVASGPGTMGHYTRRDLAFYYALADAFTICDGYHCSVMGPTDPNRLYSLSATIDPAGRAGGPVVDNPTQGGSSGLLSWTTMPERLEAAGITWKAYSFAGTGWSADISDNVLGLFRRYHDPGSALFRNGLLPTYPGDFEADVAAGNLPQVSWIVSPPDMDEHPPGPLSYGEYSAARVLDTLASKPDVWARTVLFITFDENGGFFDHVAPPVAPPGTAGEYLTAAHLPPEAGGVRGPIGLGFRVPMLVASPFSRGGWVCPDTFDHTSMLRFLETRFGVEVPNLSAWRRSVTGDLTAALDLHHPDTTVPALPDPTGAALAATAACPAVLPDEITGTDTPTYPPPGRQSMPIQERGSRRRRTGPRG